MDRFQEMQVFQAVAQTGGFAKAARRLHLSPPAVTRAVSGLEERLGVRLLQRTTRSLALTEAGQRFLADTQIVLAALENAERQASGAGVEPRGHLTITASLTFGRGPLALVLSQFLTAYPTITASLVLIDRIVNLVEEGIDIGVRIAELPDSTLIARRLGAVRRVLLASPDYLARHGAPETPGELASHRVIAFTGMMAHREWRPASGPPIAITPVIEVNDALAAISMAERGEGICGALCYMVGDAVRAGRLVPVLDDVGPPAVPVHLVHPQGRLLEPKLRAFLDFAAPRLEQALKELSRPLMREALPRP